MGIFRSDPQPVQLAAHVPAAALTTGSQPPRIASQLAMAMAVVSMAWPQAGEPHPIQPMQGRSQIAPLTLVYGQEPPRIDAMPRVQFGTVLRVSWPDDKEPRLQFNSQQPDRRYIAPLTLVYGQQPPNIGSLLATESSIAARSWDTARQQPPALIGSAAWNVPVAISGIPLAASLPPGVLASWQLSRSEPPQLVKVAPLTLVYGDQPPSDAKRVARHVAWRGWDATYQPFQAPLGSAAWNFPAIVVTQVPFVRPPLLWPQSDWSAQRPTQIAPLTITIVVPQVPFFRPSVLWVASDWSAQRGSQIVTLTLATGQNPPVNGAITPTELNQIVRAWDATWGAQSQSPSAGWNVPPIVSQPIPFTRQRHPVRLSWEPPFVYPPSAAAVAAFANVVQAALDRAIAHSDGTDSLVSLSDATGTLIQNSGLIAIVSSDSKTIQIITGNSGVISLDSDG